MKYNLLTIFLVLAFVCAQDSDEDLVDISKIDMFPQDYQHRIFSGYLTLSFSGKKFHYMYAERYYDRNSASTTLLMIPLSFG